jgi:hypothetical protein
MMSEDDDAMLDDAFDMHASRRWNSAEMKAKNWRRNASIWLYSL